MECRELTIFLSVLDTLAKSSLQNLGITPASSPKPIILDEKGRTNSESTAWNRPGHFGYKQWLYTEWNSPPVRRLTAVSRARCRTVHYIKPLPLLFLVSFVLFFSRTLDAYTLSYSAKIHLRIPKSWLVLLALCVHLHFFLLFEWRASILILKRQDNEYL